MHELTLKTKTIRVKVLQQTENIIALSLQIHNSIKEPAAKSIPPIHNVILQELQR